MEVCRIVIRLVVIIAIYLLISKRIIDIPTLLMRTLMVVVIMSDLRLVYLLLLRKLLNILFNPITDEV
jgi:hypothetical protein